MNKVHLGVWNCLENINCFKFQMLQQHIKNTCLNVLHVFQQNSKLKCFHREKKEKIQAIFFLVSEMLRL